MVDACAAWRDCSSQHRVAFDYSLGWNHSIPEVFAEDYAYIHMGAGYGIPWLAPPDQDAEGRDVRGARQPDGAAAADEERARGDHAAAAHSHRAAIARCRSACSARAGT